MKEQYTLHISFNHRFGVWDCMMESKAGKTALAEETLQDLVDQLPELIARDALAPEGKVHRKAGSLAADAQRRQSRLRRTPPAPEGGVHHEVGSYDSADLGDPLSRPAKLAAAKQTG